MIDREHEVSSKELKHEAQQLYVTEHGIIDEKAIHEK